MKMGRLTVTRITLPGALHVVHFRNGDGVERRVGVTPTILMRPGALARALGAGRPWPTGESYRAAIDELLREGCTA